MSNDSGPSKKLIIAGIVIFVVLIGTVLFFLFDATTIDRTEAEDQFVDFPVSPPNGVFTEPTVQVVTDPAPVTPQQQNAQDEIRSIVVPADNPEPEADQAELDALAYLNTQPRPSAGSGSGGGGSAPANTTLKTDRLTPEDISAALEANPDSIFLDQQMADYFSGWRPPETIAESFDQLTNQSWALEDRVDISTITGSADDQQIFDIRDEQIKSCGRINFIPDADTTESRLAAALSRETAALCLGQSIIDNCKPTSVTSAGITYLTGDFGNGCAAGVMAGGFANLCKIQPAPSASFASSDNEIGSLVASIFFRPSIAYCERYRY